LQEYCLFLLRVTYLKQAWGKTGEEKQALSITLICLDNWHKHKMVGSETACILLLSAAREKLHLHIYSPSTSCYFSYLLQSFLFWCHTVKFAGPTCIRRWSWHWCSLSPPPLWLAAGRHGWTRKAWCSLGGSWICCTAGWHWWILRYVL